MPKNYSNERLQILSKLLEDRHSLLEGRLWRMNTDSLRFKHGDTPSDIRIPYHIGASDDECIKEAIFDLTAHLKERYEVESLATSPYGKPIMSSGRPLREKSLRTDILPEASLEKRLTEELIRYCPFLDCSIIFRWLGPDGAGKKLLLWIDLMLKKSLTEETKHGTGEESTYLCMLAIMDSIRRSKVAIKSYRIRGLSYEALDITIGLALYLTMKVAISDLFERLKKADAPYYNPRVEELLSSALTPLSLLLIPSSILSTYTNPYGLNRDSINAIREAVPKLSEPYTVEELVKKGVKKVSRDKGLLDLLERHYHVLKLRALILDYLMKYDTPTITLHSKLQDLFFNDHAIKQLLGDQEKIALIVRELGELKRTVSKDRFQADAVGAIEDFIGSFKKGLMGGWKREKVGSNISHIIEAYYAFTFDEHIESFTSNTRHYLLDRRTDYTQQQLVDDYNRGVLYRFSTDKRPILRSLKIKKEGQLFIDMKDFTRKTLKVKEVAMAEFMKVNFYTPILEAATKLGLGSAMLDGDEGAIRLNSLPGDAALFSGSVSLLVALANEVQDILAFYRDQLIKRLPPSSEDDSLQSIHESFAAKRTELKERKETLIEEVKTGTKSEEDLINLTEEESRLENKYREELESVIAGEMEAGLFISYGAKAETVLIESSRDIKEPVMIAIGEKINEAARGTFRHPMVMSKLEVLLEKERKRTGNDGIMYPFEVYIDRIYNLRIPPEFDQLIERFISGSKDEDADTLAKRISEEYLADLHKLKKGKPFSSLKLFSSTSDLYNKGEAMSEDALRAYINETRGIKFFFKRSVQVNEFSDTLQKAFYFPKETLELIFSYRKVQGFDHIEIFYRVGEVIFKGFEGVTPTVVYELIKKDSEIFKAIRKDHFKGWYEEAKGSETKKIL